MNKGEAVIYHGPDGAVEATFQYQLTYQFSVITVGGETLTVFSGNLAPSHRNVRPITDDGTPNPFLDYMIKKA